MRILYSNLLKDATISATNEDANYPVGNVYNNTMLSKFQADTNSSVITCTLDEASTVSCFAIGGHNLTALAIKLTESDSTEHNYSYTPTELKFSDTITREILYITAVDDVAEIEFTCTSTTTLYIGRLDAGQYLQMPEFAITPQIKFISTGSAQKSDGGITYDNPGVILERFKCTFDNSSITDYNAVNAFFEATQKYVPHWVDRWEESTEFPIMFAQNTKDVSWTKGPEGIILDSLSMEWEECK